MRKILKVTPLENYRLLAEFASGEKRIADIKPLIKKKVFSPLEDVSLFNRAYIECGAVTWRTPDGNEIDICPDKLYMDSIPYV